MPLVSLMTVMSENVKTEVGNWNFLEKQNHRLI